MPRYHHIAAFLHHNLPQMRATRRANLALLTAAILNRRRPSPNWRAPECPDSSKATTGAKSASFASAPIRALTPSGPNGP